jgi:hypothetical protein
MNTNTTLLLEWRAASRPNHVRSDRWYLVAGLLCATFVAYGVLTGSWSMSITFAMIGGLSFLVRHEQHRLHHVRIYETCLEFDGTLHPWSTFESFWILQAEQYFELHLAPVKHSKAEIVVQTGEIDPFRLRDTLIEFLPQNTKQHERLLDAIIRFCKL